jgi:hypothetical protein
LLSFFERPAHFGTANVVGFSLLDGFFFAARRGIEQDRCRTGESKEKVGENCGSNPDAAATIRSDAASQPAHIRIVATTDVCGHAATGRLRAETQIFFQVIQIAKEPSARPS